MTFKALPLRRIAVGPKTPAGLAPADGDAAEREGRPDSSVAEPEASELSKTAPF